ncbi:MAG: hypothetical protein ABW321_05705 [Polyangiales bacterium]
MESSSAPNDAVDNTATVVSNDGTEETSGVVSVREITRRDRPQDGTAEVIAAPPRSLRERLWARWRMIGLVMVCIACFGAWRAFAGASRAPTLEQSLVRHLEKQGLKLDPAQIVWLRSDPNWLGVRPALISAKRERELHDIYYADVRIAGQLVVDVYSLTNTTRTSSADEDVLVGTRSFAAYTSRVGDAYNALVVVDTRGEPPELTARWPWYAKLQNAITNYQDSGRMRAFGLRRYNLATPASSLHAAIASGLLHVQLDGEPLVIEARKDTPLVGAELVKFERLEKGQPGTITWLVDTVRRVPAIGRAPIDWLEHTVFGLTDRVSRAYHELVKTDTAAEVKQALSVPQLPPVQEPAPALATLAEAEAEDEVAPDLGWPPAPIAPLLPERVQGEGVWLPVANDGFTTANPNGPPLFHQTFIRVDPERTYTRVYVTMWDPRQVQLGMVMGTKEPESATGETGNGLIPRDPFVMSHLVGAFNGGFQAMHGEFGMMAGKRVYLPPKPFAATVAVFQDGTTGMGSWPGPGRHVWDESFANSQIPEDMLAMRQNLTSVVEGESYNPWQRWWWGAAPEWAAEQTYIHRSGLCVTREGFMAYFWGESMGPLELGKSMLAARCVRGMHLDMNGKHTGFEFYQPYAKDTVPQDLGRALRPSEFEGAVTPDVRGLNFRARLAVTTMSPLRFPRYLGQDPRDYFYLTRKPTLPGADLSLEDGSKLRFSTRGLPNAGFPYAFARTHVAGAGYVARVDLARAVPKPLANAALSRTLGYLTQTTDEAPGHTLDHALSTDSAAAAPQSALYARYEYGGLRAHIGKPPAGATTLYSGPSLQDSPNAQAGLGVDEEGFLVYAEATEPGTLPALLRSAGVVEAIALGDNRLVFVESAADADQPDPPEAAPPAKIVGIDGRTAAVDVASSLQLMAETRPAARALFDDVTPMPYRKWGGMQDQRVRYFPSHPARFQMPDPAK